MSSYLWNTTEILYSNVVCMKTLANGALSRLASHAVSQLLIYPSSWEWEQGFSAVITIKSKSRNRLTAPEHDFRCTVSEVIPRIGREKAPSSISLKLCCFF